MVTSQELDQQIAESRQKAVDLDLQRIARIDDLRQRKALNVGLRRRINEEFGQKTADEFARIRSLEEAKRQIGAGSAEAEAIKAFVETAVGQERAERLSSLRQERGRRPAEIQKLFGQLGRGELTIEEEFVAEQRLGKLLSERGRFEEITRFREARTQRDLEVRQRQIAEKERLKELELIEEREKLPSKTLRQIPSKIQEFFVETRPPQQRIAEFVIERDIDITELPGLKQLADITRARLKEEKKEGKKISSTGFFLEKLGVGVSEAFRDIGSEISKEIGELVEQEKGKGIVKFFAETRSPQERLKEFFIETRSPQQILAEKLLEKDIDIGEIPLFKQITEIEEARLEIAPEQTSAEFFFKQLATAPPVIGTIAKAAQRENIPLGEFFVEKFGEGIEQAVTDIAEATLFKDSELFAKARSKRLGKEFEFQPLSKVVGKTTSIAAQVGLFVVPVVGEALFLAPFAEKALAGKEEFVEFVKERPILSTIAAAVVGGRIISGISKIRIPKTKLDIKLEKALKKTKLKIKTEAFKLTKDVRLKRGIKRLITETRTRAFDLTPSKEFGLIGRPPPTKISKLIKDIKLRKSVEKLIAERRTLAFDLRPDLEFGLIGRAPPTKVSKLIKDIKLKKSIRGLINEARLSKFDLIPSKEFGLIGEAPPTKISKLVKEVKLKKGIKRLIAEKRTLAFDLRPDVEFGLIGRPPPTKISKLIKDIKLRKSVEKLIEEARLRKFDLTPSKEFGLIGGKPIKPISDKKVLKALKEIRKERIKKTGGFSELVQETASKDIRQLALERFKKSQVKIKPRTDLADDLLVSGRQQELVQVLKEPEIKQIIEIIPPKKVPPVIDKIKVKVDKSFAQELFPGFVKPISEFEVPEGKIESLLDRDFVGLGKIETRFTTKVLEPELEEREDIKVRGVSLSISKTQAEVALKSDLIPIQKIESKQLSSLKSNQLQRQEQLQRQRQRELSRLEQELVQEKKARKRIIPLPLDLEGEAKPIKLRVTRKEAYHVSIRPIRKKGQPKPSLKRVTKNPTTKSQAEDIREFLLDTSLARTGKIEKVNQEPKAPDINAPVGYSQAVQQKFRRFKQVKGKRVPLPENTVIEIGTNLLDTPQEVQKIDLAKRLKQIKRPKTIKSNLDVPGGNEILNIIS